MSINDNDSPVGVVVAEWCCYLEPAWELAEKFYPFIGIEQFRNLFFCAGVVSNVVEGGTAVGTLDGIEAAEVLFYLLGFEEAYFVVLAFDWFVFDAVDNEFVKCAVDHSGCFGHEGLGVEGEIFQPF